MNAIIPALSALLGTVIGGLITFLTTYHLKKAEWKQDALTRELAKRESLYSEFLGESGRLLLQSLDHKFSNSREFQQIYALQGRIRMCATDPVMQACERLVKSVLNSHRASGEAGADEGSDSLARITTGQEITFNGWTTKPGLSEVSAGSRFAEAGLLFIPALRPLRLEGAIVGQGIRVAEREGLEQAAVKTLRLPAIDTTIAGTRTLGYTTPNGKVFLQPLLSRAEQVSTLRHESVHAFFSPRGSGPVTTFRQNLGQWGYDNSQLLRFTEEAMAETYGSGSLLQGLKHPLINDYGISASGLLLEGSVSGAGLLGAGYLGYQLGGGE